MLKKLLQATLALATMLGLVVLVFRYLLFPGCGDNEDALKMARGLSNERLSNLYYEVEKLHSQYIESEYVEPQLPEQIAGVPFKHLSLIHEWMVIGGCFDNKVAFRFYGFRHTNLPREERSIVLSWGEHTTAGEEIVWREEGPNK